VNGATCTTRKLSTNSTTRAQLANSSWWILNSLNTGAGGALQYRQPSTDGQELSFIAVASQTITWFRILSIQVFPIEAGITTIRHILAEPAGHASSFPRFHEHRPIG
jgi:hypothetical protein